MAEGSWKPAYQSKTPSDSAPRVSQYLAHARRRDDTDTDTDTDTANAKSDNDTNTNNDNTNNTSNHVKHINNVTNYSSAYITSMVTRIIPARGGHNRPGPREARAAGYEECKEGT